MSLTSFNLPLNIYDGMVHIENNFIKDSVFMLMIKEDFLGNKILT